MTKVIHSIPGVVAFITRLIAEMASIGKHSAVKRFQSTLKSILRYTEGGEVPWSHLTPTFILGYEHHLINRGLCRNSTSFYLRNLRAILNHAAQQGFSIPNDLFQHVYTGIDKTLKRAIPIDILRRIRDADLTAKPILDFARNIFLFSFYTRGMSFIDIAHLRTTDLTGDTLTYSRRKTHRQLQVRIEPEARRLIDNLWDSPIAPTTSTPYLLPILPSNTTDRQRQYAAAYSRINRNLQKLGRDLGLSTKLTLYVARHAWASLAHTYAIPLSTISSALGHDSEKTTLIYLRSIDTTSIDRANTYLIQLLSDPTGVPSTQGDSLP